MKNVINSNKKTNSLIIMKFEHDRYELMTTIELQIPEQVLELSKLAQSKDIQTFNGMHQQ